VALRAETGRGAVFPLLGAIAYWYPKITGRMMSERLGKWSCCRRWKTDPVAD
jgi:heme/copper-type cytochrome/quinol oxidase subunit 1